MDVSKRSSVDHDTFSAVMGSFPTGVAIVTTVDVDGGPCGLACNAVCSVSLEPPLLLICVDRRSRTLPALLESKKFIVNYMLEGRDELCAIFASKSSQKFETVSWRLGTNGMPCLHEDGIAWAECSIASEISVGDHVIIIGHVEHGGVSDGDTVPLVYFRRRYRSLQPMQSAWP